MLRKEVTERVKIQLSNNTILDTIEVLYADLYQIFEHVESYDIKIFLF